MDLVSIFESVECCPHVIIVLGKGGVGKTTASILLALELSRLGRTLLVSLDPARHLLKYLGISSGDPTEIHSNVYAKQISLESELEKVTTKYSDLLRELMPSLAVLNLDRVPDAIRYFPGVEEEVFLRKLVEVYKSDYDYVVVDTPPTGITVRTLILPKLYRMWLEKLIEIRERIVSLRYVIARTLGKEVDVRDRALLKLYEMRNEFDFLDRNFSSCTRTSYVVVATPEPLPMFELSETVAFLKNRLGVSPKLLILNRVLPEALALELGLIDAQRKYLDEIRGLGISYAVIEYLGKTTENLEDVIALRSKLRVFR